MRLIALTGGIATGKSTVGALLSARGAVVIDADVLAREVMVPGQPAFDEVVRRFGRAILDTEGRLDRAALAAVVFADEARRVELESITHPRINALMHARITAALRSPAPLVVADVPLLFEGGGERSFDGVMLVYASAATQMHRLHARDGLDDEAARRRLAAQLPIDEKRDRATWVIDNQGSREATAAQVDGWWSATVGSRPRD